MAKDGEKTDRLKGFRAAQTDTVPTEVGQLACRRSVHGGVRVSLSWERKNNNSPEEQRPRDQLLQSQEENISNGPEERLIPDAKINGVGHKLKERLAACGIRNAAQVSEARILDIPGFGAAKTNNLMERRRTVEDELDPVKPQSLPASRIYK